jgi:hypothetical protein
MPARLPDVVEHHLATARDVRFAVGRGGEGEVVGVVQVAPLQGQFFLLVPEGAPLVAALARTSVAEVRADIAEDDVSIRILGRGVAGRRVAAEVRRAELLNWMPEGALPGGWRTLRFHPEQVSYTTGRGESRTRAAGPVQGAAVLDGSPWSPLLGMRAAAGLAWAALLDVPAAFLLFETGWPRATGMVTSLAASGCLLVACLLWGQARRLERWQEGAGKDADAAVMLAGWRAGGEVDLAARIAGLSGILLLLLLTLASSGRAALVAFVGSAAWLVGPSEVFRQVLRRADAEEDMSRT